MKKKVLIIEDDPVSAGFIAETLQVNGYETEIAVNGADGLKKFKEEYVPVIITDIEMPVMGGKEVISMLLELQDDTVIIVQSAHNEVDLIIDIMKKGVYDYFIKPVNVQDLLIKLHRAFEAAELRHLNRVREKEKVIRLQNQMEWYQWKDKYQNRLETSDKVKLHKSLFDSLKTNFSQGAGFGMIITLIGMISTSPKDEKGNFIVDGELMELFIQNARVMEKAINQFSEIDFVIENNLELEPLDISTVFQLVLAEKNKAEPLCSIKGQKIMISEEKNTFLGKKVFINEKFFSIALYELIVNALKFSSPNSTVFLLMEIKDKMFHLSVINNPIPNQKGTVGIPEEYQNIIFEPFFRLSNYVNEQYKTLDYGLGLTLVEKIILKHNGSIKVNNLIDHLSSKPEEKVEFHISIPLIS